jgi:hypothetical protein
MLGKMVEVTAKSGASLAVCVLVAAAQRTDSVIPRGGEGARYPSTELKSCLQPLDQLSNPQLLQLHPYQLEAYTHNHNERTNR